MNNQDYDYPDFDLALKREKVLNWSRNKVNQLNKLIISERDLNKRSKLINEMNIHCLTIYLSTTKY